MLNINDLSDLTEDELNMLFYQRTVGREFGIQSIIDEINCDYESIKSLDLRHAKKNAVLDVGGGHGLMLSKFSDDYDKLFLLDKNEFNKNNSLNGLNDVKDFGGYNSFDVAKKIVGDKVNFLTPDNYQQCDQKFDLIFSWYCCGWHFSPEVYLNWCIEKLNNFGTICFLLKKHKPFIDSFFKIAIDHNVTCDLVEFDAYKKTSHSKHKTSYIGVLKRYK
jgi:hypothetical protein